ncbi:MAG: peptidase MA family metallohydrolase [Dehalococcoidales bacterium]|nr:peptidase MA family metallohydrolase [Dehalococcoidales bacterium]
MKARVKRLAAFFAVLALMFAAAPPLQSSAQTEITILKNHAVVDYPHVVTFSLELESLEKITDIRLSYQVERDSFADVVCEAVADYSSKTGSAQWIWDMYTTGNLPPGTAIKYWWQVTTQNGGTILTETRMVTFADERYQWQSISEGNLSLFWYRGDGSFASELLGSAKAALTQLETDTGAHLTRPVDIFIYGSSADLQGAMLYVQEWAGGLAFTGYGVVAIGIAPSDVEWGKRAMVHELAHLVTHQMTNNPYNSIPVWLNEGISMYAEGNLEEYSESYLRRAVLYDELISVQSLASPFSADAEKTYLSYAQSYSLVDYLVSAHGSLRMADLLQVFSQGADYDEAFLEVYGFNIDGLDDAWQAWAKEKYGVYSPQTMGFIPLYLGFLVSGLIVIAAVFVIQKKRQMV